MFSVVFIAPVAKRSEKGFLDENEPEKDEMTCISYISLAEFEFRNKLQL